ncbi:CMRF35-like molecule 1 [Otolemur garnettii]|uniref:CMRF35-like molecule 1 n=1 Tax=Otolemur garnettii TaxID=30611 RepID=UPI000C7EA51B|nr:CMRF35-like molecule 1 [Otolemur garnettii]
MQLSLALLLLILPGYSNAGSTIIGPGVVRGPERGLLTVHCLYDSEWKTYRKWWCRGANWGSCEILIVTTGSEEEVWMDRLSIKDNHKDQRFTVTMEKLTRGDADTYWCGIEKSWTDLGVQVEVMVDQGSSTDNIAITSPRPTSRQKQGSDTQKNNTSPVTTDKHRTDDHDTCVCGIKKTGTELGVQVKVTIDRSEGV